MSSLEITNYLRLMSVLQVGACKGVIELDLSKICYISSFVKIGPPVPEKIFEGFLPYIGVAAILVM